MLKRHLLAVSACLLTAALTAGCTQPGSDAGDDDSVLATVGTAVVSADEVMALLSPAGKEVPVSLATNAAHDIDGEDPFGQALRAAINDELLAQEAARQNIEGVNQAQRIARLLDRQVLSRIEGSNEAQVRAWYSDHQYLFNQVEAANLNYVVLDSSEEIGQVVAELQDSKGSPDALVESYSALDGGRISFSRGAEEVPIMIERIMNAAKYQGAIGYDKDPATGNWWIVEIQDIALESPQWGAELATKAEEAMSWFAEEDAISSFALSLEERWPVVMYEDNIEQSKLTSRAD